MPIKGMTDNVQPRFPRLGKLRKGMLLEKARQDGKKVFYPVDLDYFRFTSEQPEVEAAFYAAFNDKPRSLRVFLPYRTVEANFPTWQEEWLAGGLVHRCDGETMTVWRTKDGHYSCEPKPCPYHSGERKRDLQVKPPVPGCLPVGRLSVIIPELLEAGLVGYVTLETHSKNDLIRITASLREAEANALSAGRVMGLQGIEFRLWRQEEQISTPDSGRRVRRKKWMVLLAPTVKWVSVQYQIAQQTALGLLPATAGGEVDVDEDVEEGFDSPEEVEDYAATDGEWYDLATQDFVQGAATSDPTDPGYGEAEEEPPEREAPAQTAAPRPAATQPVATQKATPATVADEPEAPPWEDDPQPPAPAPKANGNGHNGNGHDGGSAPAGNPGAGIPARDDGFEIPDWFEPDENQLLEARDVRVNFGKKHPNETIGQIDDRDKKYIAWITTQFEPHNEYQDRVQWAARYVRSYRLWQEVRYQLPLEM